MTSRDHTTEAGRTETTPLLRKVIIFVHALTPAMLGVIYFTHWNINIYLLCLIEEFVSHPSAPPPGVVMQGHNKRIKQSWGQRNDLLTERVGGSGAIHVFKSSFPPGTMVSSHIIIIIIIHINQIIQMVIVLSHVNNIWN